MRKGFTLAEVLISLAVIGVISVLTIPSLVDSYQKKVFATELKSVYSKIYDAVQTTVMDEEVQNFAQTRSGMLAPEDGSCSQGPCFFIENYFKLTSKNCAEAQTEPKAVKACVAAKPTRYPTEFAYKTEQRGNAGLIYADYCGKTINGATLCMKTTESKYIIYVDVNGEEKPNVTGKDVYVMQIVARDNGVGSTTDVVSDLSSDPTHCNSGETIVGMEEEATDDIAFNAAGCLEKVIRAGWIVK